MSIGVNDQPIVLELDDTIDPANPVAIIRTKDGVDIGRIVFTNNRTAALFAAYIARLAIPPHQMWDEACALISATRTQLDTIRDDIECRLEQIQDRLNRFDTHEAVA